MFYRLINLVCRFPYKCSSIALFGPLLRTSCGCITLVCFLLFRFTVFQWTFRKSRFRRDQERQLEEEAKEAVSGGRSKVTYNDDDLFGETYEEPAGDNGSGTAAIRSRLREGNKEMNSIHSSRKRVHTQTAGELDLLLLSCLLLSQTVLVHTRKQFFIMLLSGVVFPQNGLVNIYQQRNLSETACC